MSKLFISIIVILFTILNTSKVNAQTKNTFKDERDGKTYKTIEIGHQTWMAENLAYKPSIGNYWALDNEQSNVAKYGYLYDWKTSKKVCPVGFHLPSDDEWKQLATHISKVENIVQERDYTFEIVGKLLKSKSGWKNECNGTDKFGFSALPSNIRLRNGAFGSDGDINSWWSSTSKNNRRAWYWYFGNSDDDFCRMNLIFTKKAGFSVRCIAD